MTEGRKRKRRHQRKAYDAHLECSTREPLENSTTESAASIDISKSGIGIITDYELNPGRVVMLKGVERPSTIKLAIVKWCRKEDNRYRSGLMFI